jgi:hypothetical protein
MATDDNGKSAVSLPGAAGLVVRSEVAPGKHYGEYKEELRHDFFYSCAYCTMSEAEAQAIRFVIDHYVPRKAQPDLENDYGNLMYCCDSCNSRKGDRYPPTEARLSGYRFFRPDEDAFGDHFEGKGIRLEAKSKVGFYSIQGLDLNRAALLKLRDIRSKLAGCEPLVAAGILGLRRVRLDLLPPAVRGAAFRAIKKAEETAQQMADGIDQILRTHARSELVDPDPKGRDRGNERAAELAKVQSVVSWKLAGT